ncbi:MAG: M6 family metalloprotease domain-containing protein [Prevotella sp.]|jgi:immune inhibitor A
MRKLFIIFFFAMLGLSAMAVPAERRWQTFRQSDKSEITVQLQGDECAHWFVTLDSKVVARKANGDFCYLTLSHNTAKQTTASTILAHNEADRSEAERAFVSQEAISVEEYRQIASQHRQIAPHKTSTPQPRRAKFEGKRKGLFILVQFEDIKFSRTDIQQAYDSICNFKNYSSGKFTGSVGDYFREQSDGQFELDFDVVGPVTVSKDEAYYGENSGWSTDGNLCEMVIEALNLIGDSLDFTQYDWNEDGKADQVFFLYAGYGEAQYAPSWTIWPCEGALSNFGYISELPKLGGVTFDTFACSCELHGNEGSQLDGIGTICHEFSHCMGLPDFYNTSDMTDFCMDAMDVMDQGAYNGHGGYSPAAYTGYERWYCGWRDFVELTDPQEITDWQPLVSGGATYILYNKADSTEYFLLDNREHVGFDEGMYATGMVVTHVHYDADAWENNTVNTNKDHKRMAILPADGIYDYKTCSKDAFPYTYMGGQRTLDSLSDYSHPYTKLFVKNTNGTYRLGKPLYKITKNEDMTMSFSFMIKPEADAIREVAVPKLSTIYNLSGVAVGTDLDRLPKGIYIRNGKKVLK